MFYPHLLIFLAYILLIFYVDIGSCKGRNSSKDSVTLPVNGTRKFCRGVTLRVNSIQDSRCAAGVQCIWAGQADVQLRLSKRRASSTVNLTISAGPGTHQNSAQVTLNTASYGVTLQNVVPYPGTGSPPMKAVVQVKCP